MSLAGGYEEGVASTPAQSELPCHLCLLLPAGASSCLLPDRDQPGMHGHVWGKGIKGTWEPEKIKMVEQNGQKKGKKAEGEKGRR
jgi:hypothetical protein